MPFWLLVLLIIWGVGALVGMLVVMMMAVDEYWKFSQLALCLIWPVMLVWMVVFDADIPGWFERHWG